jgi:hypothetical protein
MNTIKIRDEDLGSVYTYEEFDSLFVKWKKKKFFKQLVNETLIIHVGKEIYDAIRPMDGYWSIK